MPGTFQDVIDLLIPELRRRGIFWDDYTVPGGTYRENLYEKKGQAEPPDTHPASAYAWNPPEQPAGVSGVDGHVETFTPQEEVDPVRFQLG